MKKSSLFNFILCLLLIVNLNVATSQDGTSTWTDREVINLFNHIDSLEQTNEVNELLIKEYEKQLIYNEAIRFKDSLISVQQFNQLNIYKDQVNLLQLTIEEVQPKWYDNKTIWFGLGVFLTIFAVKVD